MMMVIFLFKCQFVFVLLQDVLKKMTEATDGLKQALGKTLDAWVTPDRCE